MGRHPFFYGSGPVGVFGAGQEKKPLIISFNGPAGEAYIGKFIKGIKATAAQNGYDIEVYENQFNQAEQDQQVQQVLAAGKKPDVFLWWPSDATAGLGSLRALYKTGVPVLKINQLPNDQDKKYIFGYAGPDDRLRAANAGKMIVEAAKAKKAAGGKGFQQLIPLFPQLVVPILCPFLADRQKFFDFFPKLRHFIGDLADSPFCGFQTRPRKRNGLLYGISLLLHRRPPVSAPKTFAAGLHTCTAANREAGVGYSRRYNRPYGGSSST